MTTTVLHAMPRYWAVFRAQVRALWTLLRRERWLLLGVMVLVWIVTFFDAFQNCMGAKDIQSKLWKYEFEGSSGAILLAAILVPFGVWRADRSTRRLYHRSMPVAQVSHTLIKVCAGFIWFLGASLVLVLIDVAVGSVAAWFSSGHIGLDTSLWDGDYLRGLSGLLTVYLLASAFVIKSNHAKWWIVGVTGGCVAALSSDFVRENANGLNTVLTQILAGRYGFVPALTGSWPGPHWTFTLANGKAHMSSPEIHLSLLQWLPVMALWMIISLIAVYLAAYQSGKDS